MKETISLENAKDLHVICKEKEVKMIGSRYKHFYGEWDRPNPVDIFGNVYIGKSGWIIVNTYRHDDYSDWLLPAYTTNELFEWFHKLKRFISLENNDDFRKKVDYEAYSNKDVIKTNAETPQDALCLLLINHFKPL